MAAKREMCPCGFPQSHPIPHEHDRTDREKQIIAHYEHLHPENMKLKQIAADKVASSLAKMNKKKGA